jgi:hypothetical protein
LQPVDQWPILKHAELLGVRTRAFAVAECDKVRLRELGVAAG